MDMTPYKDWIKRIKEHEYFEDRELRKISYAIDAVLVLDLAAAYQTKQFDMSTPGSTANLAAASVMVVGYTVFSLWNLLPKIMKNKKYASVFDEEKASEKP
jgi:membrane protein YdbS with pleckstrin-like domain